MVVFLEHGGGGGAYAAPMAKEMFRAYYAKKNNPEVTGKAAAHGQGGDPK